MTPAAIIANLHFMKEDLASLRAQVAALTAAPATTTEPGLDLDARVPCASCGGEFVWTFPKDDDPWFAPVSARCQCGVEWNNMPAPVTWRTLATSGDEVPAAYVARLVSEVDRLRALLTDSTPSPAQSTAQDAHRCPRCGAGSPEVCGGAREWWLECGRCGHTSRSYHTEEDAIAGGFSRSPASAPSSTAAPHSGAEPTVEAGALLHGALRALAAAGHFVEFCYHPDAERGDGTGWVLVIGDTHNYGDLDTLAAHAVKRAGEVSDG